MQSNSGSRPAGATPSADGHSAKRGGQPRPGVCRAMPTPAPTLTPEARRALHELFVGNDLRRDAVELLDRGMSSAGAKVLARARQRHHQGLTLLAGMLRHVAAP